MGRKDTDLLSVQADGAADPLLSSNRSWAESEPLILNTASVELRKEWKSPRLDVLDCLRGFIMVVMAVDHVSAIAAHVHGSEEWTQETTYNNTATGRLHFATRFATHMCAPGFSFLMGFGLVFFSISREKLGWTTWQIARHHIVRALVLLIPCHYPIEYYAFLADSLIWKSLDKSKGVDIFTTVLFTLSTSMLVCGITLACTVRYRDRVRKWGIPVVPVIAFVTIVIVSFGLSIGLVDHYKHLPADTYVNWFVRLLAVPGRTGVLSSLYVVVPWTGICSFGVLSGLFFADKGAFYTKLYSGTVAIFCYTLFGILRSTTSFGSFLPLPPHANGIQFLNVVKYPPDICYVLITFAILHTLIFLFSCLSGLEKKPFSHFLWFPLQTFGNCALFYYLMHLVLIFVTSLGFQPNGISFPYVYLYWAILELVLFPMCYYYGRFKRSTPPGSIWRFF